MPGPVQYKDTNNSINRAPAADPTVPMDADAPFASPGTSFTSTLLVQSHVGLTLLVVVSTNNFPATNTAKASKLLGDENFRSAVTETGV